MAGDKDRTKIADLTLKELWQKSVNSKPEITGGSLIVASANMAISLILMPLEISAKKIRNSNTRDKLLVQITILKALRESLLVAAGEDLSIFNSFRSLSRKKTMEDNPEYLEILEQATESPMEIAKLLQQCISIALECFPHCKKNLISDLGSGLYILQSCLKGILLLSEGNINSLTEGAQKVYRQQKQDLEIESRNQWEEIEKYIAANCSMIKT